MNNDHCYACVLAGGTGERFWPMSRAKKPKHLLKLLSERTLIEETVRRLDGVVAAKNIFVLTNEAQLSDIRAALPLVPAEQIIAEPARRDSGPAAALANGLIRARDPEAVVALLAVDAFSRDSARCAAQLAAALAWAGASDELLTFAIKPTFPSTGFGYLEMGEELERAAGGVFRRVRRFVEKPDAATARRYLNSGQYAWNASIFVWRAGVFLAEAERHAPELAAFMRDFPAGDFTAYLEDALSDAAKNFPGLCDHGKGGQGRDARGRVRLG